MIDLSVYKFAFKGEEFTHDSYGADYLQRFVRMCNEYGGANCRRILEWGSGFTSLVLQDLAETWGSELFLTIDDYGPYQEAVFKESRHYPFVVRKTLNQIGPSKSQADPELSYSSIPLAYNADFDLIFIDGRRRMECAYNAALVSHRDTVVIIHDFRRSRYQSIRALFDVVEEDTHFRVMKIRPAIHEALQPGRERLRGYFDALRHNRIKVD